MYLSHLQFPSGCLK